jgi:methyl-accepting chemotaxis protein
MQQYGHIEDMQVMEREHESLHTVIREIIDLKQQGNDARAEQRFGEIETLSGKIVDLLKSVERNVAGGGV